MAGSSETDNTSSSTGLEVEVAAAGGGGGGGEAVASTAVTGGGAAVTTGEMAAALVSEGLKTEKDDDEVVYGFQRPEMQKKVALVGSVEHYERHVFLCYHAPESWPSKIEKAEYDPLPNSLVSALRNRKTDLPKKVRFFDSPMSLLLFLAGFSFRFSSCLFFCVCVLIELRNRLHQFFGFSLGNSSQ
jgi:hypothetical protein